MTFESLKEAEDRLQELYILLADPEVIADTARIRELGREHRTIELHILPFAEIAHVNAPCPSCA